MHRSILLVLGALGAAGGVAALQCATTKPLPRVTPPRSGEGVGESVSTTPQSMVASPPPVQRQVVPKTTTMVGASRQPKTGDEGLAAELELEHPTSTPALQMMQQYDRDELLLIALVTKRSGQAPPPAIGEIIERRRTGSSQAELMTLADTKLAGDPAQHLAVREWLTQYAKPANMPARDARRKSSMNIGGAVIEGSKDR